MPLRNRILRLYSLRKPPSGFLTDGLQLGADVWAWITPGAPGSRNTRARARIARAGSCGERRQFRGEGSGDSNWTDGRAEDLPIGRPMRIRKQTMPAISSKPAWAWRLERLCPNRRYPLGRDGVAAIAGFQRIPGGLMRAT